MSSEEMNNPDALAVLSSGVAVETHPDPHPVRNGEEDAERWDGQS